MSDVNLAKLSTFGWIEVRSFALSLTEANQVELVMFSSSSVNDDYIDIEGETELDFDS